MCLPFLSASAAQIAGALLNMPGTGGSDFLMNCQRVAQRFPALGQLAVAEETFADAFQGPGLFRAALHGYGDLAGFLVTGSRLGKAAGCQ